PHRRRIAGAARASQCEGSELASTSLNLHQSHELRYIGSVFDLKLLCCPRLAAPTLVTLPSMSLIPFAPFSFSAFPDFSFLKKALPSSDSSFNQT
ncbi:MAG: hypothetical protein WA183_11600, partial [Chthoniobacterales bacterium]